MRVKPGQLLPRVKLPLVRGGRFTLGEKISQKMLLIVFYRGLHCRRCGPYLKAVQDLLPDFAQNGIKVVAVSADSEQRARQSADRWGIDTLDVAYELPIETARELGLFVTRGVREHEPGLCIEPATFFVGQDGRLVASVTNSLTQLHPPPKEILDTSVHMLGSDSPPKGAD